MLTLARADELFGQCNLVAIHHFQSQKYYNKILRCKHNGEIMAALADAPAARPALQVDMDEDEVDGDVGQALAVLQDMPAVHDGPGDDMEADEARGLATASGSGKWWKRRCYG